ncbi:hypothetical protein CVT24_009864 [Panaeolus cyanescens]|uniref:Uncharacterized protein n=1 Tax=Panaeolus cyanescens TaxID=181874 RepID=A0A409VXY1_9AGAR|nr:hypothetical protein CVT24_009864 [Panaeolus cyanescens]
MVQMVSNSSSIFPKLDLNFVVLTTGAHFALLPTPSPELGHPSAHHHPHHHHHHQSSHDMFMPNPSHMPSWEVMRSESSSVPTGSKRAHDYNPVDEFFIDMKKRRVNPSYDPRMAERLNNIAYQQNGPSPHHPSSTFNPRSVSLDIRTPEELAAVNQFLVTLGRDVSGSLRPPVPPSHSNFPSDSYFDPANLSQLGLAGMPGLPASSSNFPENPYTTNEQPQYGNPSYSSRSSHPSVQSNPYGYPAMNDSSMGYSPSSTDYPSNGSRRSNHGSGMQRYYHHPTPPLESSSPHSTASTPVTTTPPQVPMSMPPDFDYIRTSRGPPPVAHLAPPEYINKPMRPAIPLKSLPSNSQPPTRPPVGEPKYSLSAHRPKPSTSSISKPGSLYPLLTSGDIQYKLPPLNRMFRSPSPPSRESTPSSTHSSPILQPTVLPSIHSLARSAGSRSPVSDDLSSKIGQIDISPDERRRHAELILEMLVSINSDFKRRQQSARPPHSPPTRDIEMTVA